METDWFLVLDRIEDFYLEKSKNHKAWYDWFAQYKILLRATAFDMLPNRQRVALLLMKCKGFKFVWEVLSIDDDTIEYDALVAKLNNYFTPVYARNAFFSRRQQKNETFEEFAKALKALSVPCNFHDKEIVRDAFVLNMSNDTIAHQILIAGDLSLEEAIHRAKFLAHEPESNGSYSDLTAEEPSDIFSRKHNILSITSTKMPLPSEGTHIVEVIGFGPNGVAFVVPTHMIKARDVFLDELQRLLKGCNEPEPTPDKGCSYSVLVNCIWHRVIVISIEAGKKATAESIDFGWTKVLPFSVFRNTPLDCRVVPPLIWTVSFRRPVPAQVLPGAHLKVSLTQINNSWIASLAETTVTSKGGFRRSQSPFSSGEDHSVIKQRQHSDYKNTSGRQRDGRGATEGFHEKRRRARSETRERVTDNLPAPDPARSMGLANFRLDGDGYKADVGRGAPKKSTGTRESDDYSNSDCSERSRGQRDNRSRDGNHNRQEQFKRNYHEKDSWYTRSESARNYNPPDNQFRGQGGFNRISQEKDNAGSIRARIDNPHNNPFRGQGDNFTRNQQETDNRSTRSNQFRNGNPSNQPFRTGDRHVGESNQPRNGNLPNDQPYRGQGDFSRKPRESGDGFTGGKQSQNGYPPSNRPSRRQCDSNRNSVESDNGYTRKNQPRNGNPQGLGRGYPSAPTNKPVTSRSQPVFTPRPVEQLLAGYAPINNYASAQPEPSDESDKPHHPPIPLDQFSEITVIYRSESGVVFCTFQDKAEELVRLTLELRGVQSTVLSDPRIDMWCLVENGGDNYRAQIFRVHSSGKKFRVRLFDFGEEKVKVSEEIMVLPQKYHKIPPYAFGVKLPEGVYAEEGDSLIAKPVCEDDNGVWLVEVDQTRTTPTQPAQSTRSPTPPRRPQLPPIPKNTFTVVRVMYTGPEGNFVVDVSKLDDLKRIQDQILDVPKMPLKGFPEKGGLYIAPYDGGEFYRAKVLSAEGNKCVVLFVDFGNEAEVRASDLIQLPKSLQGNVHTFKITLDRDSSVTLIDGHDVKITPLVMETSGSWLVQVEGEPSYPDLPDDSDISFSRE